MVALILLSLLFLFSAALILTFNNCILLPSLKSLDFNLDETLFSSNEINLIKLNEISEKSDKNVKNLIAFVKNESNKESSKKLFNYLGPKNCEFFVQNYESEYENIENCLGFGNCAEICSQNAIKIIDNVACVNELCSACGKCLNECPKNLISLVEKKSSLKENLENSSLSKKSLNKILSIFNRHFNFYSKCYKLFK